MKKIKKFMFYYKPYKKLFFADMFFALLASIISLIYPLIVRYITNNLLINHGISEATNRIILLIIVMIGLGLLEYLSNFFVTYKGHVMGTLIERDMRNDIFNHYQKLSYNYFDNQKTGQLLTRITNDLFDITELSHHGPEDLVISIIKFVGAFIILLQVNVPLTLIIFLFIPIMMLFANRLRKKMRDAFQKNRERIAEINAQIEDSLSGIRVVKSFANEAREIEKFKKGNENFVESKRNSYWYMAQFHSGLGLFINLMSLTVIAGGALFMANEIIVIADFITFFLYINNVIEPVRKLINFTEQFQNGMTGFDRFLEVMDEEADIKDKKDAITIKNTSGNFEFKNVSFKYIDANEPVFCKLNLSVQSGEYLALVGTSGVGKTTLCNLIPRFYDVSSGSITLDGTDIRDIKLKSLRDNIGIVQQDVYLFSGTVADNIRYGKLDATNEEIIEAAKNANAHDFIKELPEGYDTDIGQRGVKLSGGQKQRLSIARVFLKNPPILIFDEATSALDNESEKVVQDSLEVLAKNRTTFVIAHRLSTIRNAENIIVLTEEGIEEKGSHEELMTKKGIYYNLYETNLSKK